MVFLQLCVTPRSAEANPYEFDLSFDLRNIGDCLHTIRYTDKDKRIRVAIKFMSQTCDINLCK